MQMELCDLNSADSGAAAALLESKNEELPEPNRDELVDLELEKHDAFLCSIRKEVLLPQLTANLLVIPSYHHHTQHIHLQTGNDGSRDRPIREHLPKKRNPRMATNKGRITHE